MANRGGSRTKRRIGRYILAAREVRDFRGNLILSEEAAQNIRTERVARFRSFHTNDQSGIGMT